MSQPPRPVYVPRHKRHKQPERLHGAFAGGFSAGYFNTVGSAAGWKPENNDDETTATTTPKKKRAMQQQQRPEDFMDDQDFDDFGGPTQARIEYHTVKRNDNKKSENDNANVQDFFTISLPTRNIGYELLRKLGWRDATKQALLPDNEPTTKATSSDNSNLHVISRKRLRRLQLSSNIKIPTPKLDQCGLGYEPHQNAPEFQRHVERQRQQHQKQTRLQRYRVNDVLGGMDNENDADANDVKDSDNANDDTYDRVERLVGSHTMAGFAMDDDADQAFDDSLDHRNDEYATEIVDDASDDESDHEEDDNAGVAAELKKRAPKSKSRTKATDFGILSTFGAMSSLTTTSSNGRTMHATSVTSDGKAPLPGFSLGGGTSNMNRFPGPDLPPNYVVAPHVFGPNDHPSVYATLSRAVQIEQHKQRQQATAQQALATARVQPKKAFNTQAFAGLQNAMQSRFVTAQATSSDIGNMSHLPGLRSPAAASNQSDTTVAANNTSVLPAAPTTVTVQRSSRAWQPTSLLCKRFRVPAISTSAATTMAAATTREESYFVTEIMAQARGAVRPRDETDGTVQTPSQKSNKSAIGDDTDVMEPKQRRPNVQTNKSVFGNVSSDDDDDDPKEKDDDKHTMHMRAVVNNMSDDDDARNGFTDAAVKGAATALALRPPARAIHSNANDTAKHDMDDASQASSRSTASSRKKKKRKHKDKAKKERRPSRDVKRKRRKTKGSRST